MALFTSSPQFLKNIFQHKKATGRHNSHRDWLIIVFVFSVMFIFVILLSMYLFSGISNNTLFKPTSENSTSPVPVVDRTSFLNTMSYYTDKAAKLESLKTTPLSLIDPGL